MTVIVTTSTCMVCGLTGTVSLTDAEFAALNTTYIQDALPERTAGEREQIISGTHPDCFDAMFGTEDDE